MGGGEEGHVRAGESLATGVGSSSFNSRSLVQAVQRPRGGKAEDNGRVRALG